MIDWQPYLDAPMPPSAATVQAVEARVGGAFPAEILALVRERGGQAPINDVVPLPGGGRTALTPVLVGDAAPGSDNATYTITYALDALHQWNRSGVKGLLPFATNGETGWFCANLSTTPASIVFVDTGYDPTEKGAITPVAANLDDLLSRLTR